MTQRKPWVTTLALVGFAVLLAAYIFLVEAKREPPPEEGIMQTPAPLWEFEGSDLVEISVTRGEQTTAVERSGDGWRMTAPEAGEADSGRLSGLASQVAAIKSTRALADVDDLSAYGLKEPEARATLVFSDGTTINLNIGAENPRHTSRYVQVEAEPHVYLITLSDVDGLLRLIDEPPYPPVPTPPPSPVETPSS